MKLTRYVYVIVLWFVCCQTAWAQADRQFIRNGNKYFRAGDYAKAEIEYRKAVGANGNNAQALYNLGTTLLAQQKDSAAIAELEKAGKVEKAPLRKAKVYHNIGVICQGHQMYGEAIEAYKESLRNNPRDNETRYNLALCQRQAKKNPQNQNNQNDKNKDNKDKNKDKDKDQKQEQNKDKEKQNQQQQPQDKMSKENAEQLLNYAEQAERATQQRMKQQQSQPQRRRLQKNW